MIIAAITEAVMKCAMFDFDEGVWRRWLMTSSGLLGAFGGCRGARGAAFPCRRDGRTEPVAIGSCQRLVKRMRTGHALGRPFTQLPVAFCAGTARIGTSAGADAGDHCLEYRRDRHRRKSSPSDRGASW